MKPNRAKSINVVTKINKATNRWVLMTEKQNRLTFTFRFIQPVFVTNIKVHLHGLKIQYQNRSVFGLDRPSSDGCPLNTRNLVLCIILKNNCSRLKYFDYSDLLVI